MGIQAEGDVVCCRSLPVEPLCVVAPSITDRREVGVREIFEAFVKVGRAMMLRHVIYLDRLDREHLAMI